MSPLRLYPLIALAVAAVASAAVYLRRRRKTDAERERERRQLINRTGRITDGTITDVQELTPDGHGTSDAAQNTIQLIIYSYDVAGVSYEASQDVSHLGQDIDLHAAQLGLPASVKYLPHNPGNSIVIAEGWSGLRG